jgi:hypothetical protein
MSVSIVDNVSESIVNFISLGYQNSVRIWDFVIQFIDIFIYLNNIQEQRQSLTYYHTIIISRLVTFTSQASDIECELLGIWNTQYTSSHWHLWKFWIHVLINTNKNKGLFTTQLICRPAVLSLTSSCNKQWTKPKSKISFLWRAINVKPILEINWNMCSLVTQYFIQYN